MSKPPKHRPTRREFIAVSSMAIAGLATAKRSTAAQPAELPSVLSVGYWDGLYSAPGDATPVARILHAETIAPDTLFRGTGAYLRVRGLRIAPERRFTPISLSLIALYPAIDPETGAKVPFVAWNYAYRGRAGGPLTSSFIVPVDARNRLQIVVDRAVRVSDVPTQTSGDSDRQRLRSLSRGDGGLTFGLSPAPFVLRRGYFFIALRDRAEQSLPSWESIRMSDFRSSDVVKPDTDGILFASHGSPVDFDYIVLSMQPYGTTELEGKERQSRQP